MVSRAINDIFDSWYFRELNFPRPKDQENYGAPQVPLVKFIGNCTRNHAITSTNNYEEVDDYLILNKREILQRYFVYIQDFFNFLGTPILCETSEWMVQDCILALHLYAISKCTVSRFQFFVFDLSLITQNASVKCILFKKYQVFRKGSSDIGFFVDHLVFNIFKQCPTPTFSL